MKLVIILIAALMPSLALAQEPSESTKIRALKRAYELNANSMAGWVSIDLSKEDWNAETDPMGPVVAHVEPEKKCKRFRRGKCRD